MLLETRKLRKAFGGVVAVNDIDFELKEGEIRAIIGPNGAGKTTFFNLITGYHTPDAGRIIFNGVDITALPPYRVSMMGITRAFQIINIFPRLKVIESVQLALLARRRITLNMFSSAKKMLVHEAMRILEIVGLKEYADFPSSNLSHGDQRILELALALAGEGKLLLLDEPTAGMSPWERAKITGLIKRIRDETGITILFSEHDMDVVFGISERITVFHMGTIIADGKPEDVRGNREVRMVYLGERGHAGSN